MLAVLTVNSLLNNSGSSDGLVTLREAVAAANADTMTELGQTGSGADTIEFSTALSGIVNLSTIGDSAAGPSALVITSPITILGNSNGITLFAGAGATAMRHFRVAAGASLTLDTIMLTGGVARGATGSAGENGGDGRGGAIYHEGTLTVMASTIYSNKAVGGIAGAGGSSGVGRGGAIYNAAGTVTIRNATFSGNQALNSNESGANSALGGSIHSLNGNLQIFNSTLTNGTAVTGRGVYVLADGGSGATAHIESNIIGEAGPASSQADFAALQESESDPLILTGSNNLIRRALNFTDVWDVDPLLNPLANNGGPTLTHAMRADSPAINNGTNTLNLPADQRGTTFSRAIGAADIGAYEQQAVPPALVGDFNLDSIVNAADYVMWRKTMNTDVAVYSGADANGDTHVDIHDHELWKSNFGEHLNAGFRSATNIESLETATFASSGAEMASDSLVGADPVVSILSELPFDDRGIAAAGIGDERKASAVRVSRVSQNSIVRERALLAVLADRNEAGENDVGHELSLDTLRDADCASPIEAADQMPTAMAAVIGQTWRWL